MTVLEVHCPACGEAFLARGTMVWGEVRREADTLYREPDGVEDIAPDFCPWCTANVEQTVAEAIHYHEEDAWRRR